MAVKGTADRIVLYNYNRPDATPPLIFPDFNDSATFTFSIWAKVLDTTTPDVLYVMQGTLGSQLVIEMGSGIAGPEWRLLVRHQGVQVLTRTIAQIAVGRWALFIVVKNGPFLDLLYGIEDLTFDPFAPVQLIHVVQAATTPGVDLIFDHTAFVVRNNIAVCNYKFWNAILTLPEVTTQAHEWDANASSGGSIPMWASTLRTPGDISSIAHPYTSRDWAAGHGYTVITPNADSFVMEIDPAYLSHYQPCPTWIYPLVGTGLIFHNPGNTPLVQTTYKSAIHCEFQDKGSLPVPAMLLSLNKAEFYAFPFTSGTGPGPSDSWPLYHDENGNELVTNLGDPANRFEQDTGVPIPLPFDIVAIYAWQFGAQFTWAPAVPQQPAGTGNIGYQYLLITYVGTPSGKPSLPVQDLVGLFAIRRDGVAVDQYNRGVQLKIPDPTIRTAFLGE